MRTNCIYSFVQKQTTYSITRALSDPRFKTYIQAAGGSEKQALLLYLWNIEMAGAVAATTGMVEVQLRNSINSRLQTWNASQPINDPNRSCAYTRNWLKDPAPRLRQIISPPRKRPLWQKAEPALRDELGNCAKPNPSHDDLVAALPFGSWLFILPQPQVSSPQNPRMRIWDETLKHAFTARNASEFQSANPAVIYQWANAIRHARNRASHLEPLLDPAQLIRVHRISARLMHSMNPAAASWLAGQQYIHSVLKRKPV